MANVLQLSLPHIVQHKLHVLSLWLAGYAWASTSASFKYCELPFPLLPSLLGGAHEKTGFIKEEQA